jgi:hypothetical protein
MRSCSHIFQNVTGCLDSSLNNTQIPKKISVETKSGKSSYEHFKFDSFSGFFRKKTMNFYSKLFFKTLVFVEEFFQEKCFLLEKKRVIVLKNS